jgi:pyruvate kinase
MRRTKIIATAGPATDSDDALDALIAAGVDIVRLNFSHGTHESQAVTFARAKRVGARAATWRSCPSGRAQDSNRPAKDGRPIDLVSGGR